MAALTTIAAIVTAVAATGGVVAQSVQGRRAATQTKKEAGRAQQEQAQIEADLRQEEEKEEANLTRDQQRRARVAQRAGSSGREGTLIPLQTAGGGGQSAATKQDIGI